MVCIDPHLNLSICQLFSRWSVGEKQSAISEERLLRRLPFFRPSAGSEDNTSPGPVVAHSSRVDLDTPKHYLNTLSITSTSPSPTAPPPAVLLHGYGAGLGFYYQNLPALSSWASRRQSAVYALDWLGMGRSARVPFTIKSARKDIPGRVKEAEAFFVDSLEEWRGKMGLDQMTLVGHSLGAYFSVCYALKFPERVNKLILLSPAGVPRGPDYSAPARELDEVESAASHSSASGANASGSKGGAELATDAKIDEIEAEQRTAKANESRSRKLLTYLWEEGWSPFQVVRKTFFWGPMLVGKVS